jgi:large subunit ribosomal protein L9
MKVILKQPVKGIGEAGTIKEVSDGYARNFLLPRGLAVSATEGMLKKVEEHKAAEARRSAKAEEDMAHLAQLLDGQTVTVKAKAGEQHRLYGSITNGDIAEAVQRETHHEIDKKKIELPEPIRTVGTHDVAVRLTGKLIPHIKVVVEPEE